MSEWRKCFETLRTAKELMGRLVVAKVLWPLCLCPVFHSGSERAVSYLCMCLRVVCDTEKRKRISCCLCVCVGGVGGGWGGGG